MKKTNQKGFSVVEAAIIVVVIGLLGFVGWRVVSSRSKDKPQPATTSNAQSKSATDTKNATPKETYCDPTEKSCITFETSWKKKITTATDQDGNTRNSLELANSSYPSVRIQFTPYLYGIGGGCQPGTIVSVENIAKAKGQKLVVNTWTDQEVRDSQPVGDATYRARLAVTSDKLAELVTVGETECIGLGVYENESYSPSRSGSLTAWYINGTFFSQGEVDSWLAGKDVAAAKKVLLTLDLP